MDETFPETWTRMKSHLLMLAGILALFFFCMVASAGAVSSGNYIFTFNGGVDEGFTRYNTHANSAIPSYSSSLFRSSDAIKYASVVRSINVTLSNNNPVTISFKGTISGGYIRYGFGNKLTTSTDCASCGIDLALDWHNSGNSYFFLNDSIDTSCPFGTGGTQTNSTIKTVWYLNGTIKMYYNGTLTCTKNEGSFMTFDQNYTYFFAYVKDTNHYIDDINISWGTQASSTMVLNSNLQNSNPYSSSLLTVAFNGTFTGTTNYIFDCSLYENASLKNTSLGLNLSGTQYLYLTKETQEISNNYTLRCNNTEFDKSTASYYYTFDDLSPRISSDFVNNSVYDQFDTLSTYFNFTDWNITKYNISLKVGDTVLERYDSSQIGRYQENRTSRILTTKGNYTLNVTSQDYAGHVTVQTYFFTVSSSSGNGYVNLTYLEEKANATFLNSEQMKGDLEMIYLAILYGVLMASSFLLIFKGNGKAGLVTYAMTLPLDIIFILDIWNNHVVGKIDATWTGQLTWLVGVACALWLMMKLIVPFTIKLRG